MTRFIVGTLLTAFSVTAAAADNPYRLETLLQMPDVAATSAVPRLEETLKTGGSSIAPCAAAQALFLMGSPGAKAILAKYLFYPHYDLDYSIDLAFHWQMTPAKRDDFIRSYHLQSRSKDVSICLKAAPQADGKAGIQFVLSLVNTSARSLRFNRPSAYLGRHILLVTQSGEFMESCRSIIYLGSPGAPDQTYAQVEPGHSLDIVFTGQVKTFPDSPDPAFRNFVWLDCDGFMHKLTASGTFRVYARYAHEEGPAPAFDNIWTGRVVSEPVEIQLKDMQEPTKSTGGGGQ